MTATKYALPCVLEMLRHLPYVHMLSQCIAYVIFPFYFLNYYVTPLDSLLYPEHVYVNVSDFAQTPTTADLLSSTGVSANVHPGIHKDPKVTKHTPYADPYGLP